MADDRATGSEPAASNRDEAPDVTGVAGDSDSESDVVGNPATTAAAVPSETVGTGSYVAVSCVAAMGLLLLVLIVGLLISRWLG